MPLISKSYAKILSNYNKAIEKLASEEDFKKISIANKVFEDVLASLQLISLGQIKLESLAELEKVDFLNDTNITQNLLLNNSLNKENKSGIFIRKSRAEFSNDILLGKIMQIDEKNVFFVGQTPFGFSKREISLSDFEKNFISIEEFLTNANFSANLYRGLNGEEISLYSNSYLRILLIIKNMEIVVEPVNFTRYVSAKEDKSLVEPYKNKDFMLQEIIRYVNEIVEKQTKTNDYIYPDFKKVIKK